MKKFNLSDYSIIYGILIAALMIVGQSAWGMKACSDAQIAYALTHSKQKFTGRAGIKRESLNLQKLNCVATAKSIAQMQKIIAQTKKIAAQHMCHGPCPGIQKPRKPQAHKPTTNPPSATAAVRSKIKRSHKFFIPTGTRHYYSNGISRRYYKLDSFNPRQTTKTETGLECDSHGNCKSVTRSITSTDYTADVTISRCKDFGCDGTQTLAVDLGSQIHSIEGINARIRATVKELASCQVNEYGDKRGPIAQKSCQGRQIMNLPRKDRLAKLKRLINNDIKDNLHSTDAKSRQQAIKELKALRDSVDGEALNLYLKKYIIAAHDEDTLMRLALDSETNKYHRLANFNQASIISNRWLERLNICERVHMGTGAGSCTEDLALFNQIKAIASVAEDPTQNPYNRSLNTANQAGVNPNNRYYSNMNRGAGGRTSAQGLFNQFNNGGNMNMNMNRFGNTWNGGPYAANNPNMYQQNLNGRMPFNSQFGPPNGQFGPPNGQFMPNQFATTNQFGSAPNPNFNSSTFASTSPFTSVNAQFSPNGNNVMIPSLSQMYSNPFCNGPGPVYCHGGI